MRLDDTVRVLGHILGLDGRRPDVWGSPSRCRNLLPGKNWYMWWLGRSPNHHIYSSLLRARQSFIPLLKVIRDDHRTKEPSLAMKRREGWIVALGQGRLPALYGRGGGAGL